MSNIIIEVLLIIATIIAFILAARLLASWAHLIINAVLGIIIIYVANVFFFTNVAYSIPAILVSAFGGVPGAVLVILLHVYGIAF
jgi:hypothetical protein